MTDLPTLGRAAFDAWAHGEATGDYTAFKALLTDAFHHYAHPLMGRYHGHDALTALRKLIAEREAEPNLLTFTNITAAFGADTAIFQFDSRGKIAGGSLDYDGYNVIALEFADGVLTGFREYFGLVEPGWFREG